MVIGWTGLILMFLCLSVSVSLPLQSNKVPVVQHPHMSHLSPLLSYSPDSFPPQTPPPFSPDAGKPRPSPFESAAPHCRSLSAQLFSANSGIMTVDIRPILWVFIHLHMWRLKFSSPSNLNSTTHSTVHRRQNALRSMYWKCDPSQRFDGGRMTLVYDMAVAHIINGATLAGHGDLYSSAAGVGGRRCHVVLDPHLTWCIHTVHGAGMSRAPHPAELSPYYPLSPGGMAQMAHPPGWL